MSIWLGEIVYPATFDRGFLELAEHCLVSFWLPPLNEQKTVHYPKREICLVSQWFNLKGQARRNRPTILKYLPDVMWWDEERWRSGKLRVWYEE